MAKNKSDKKEAPVKGFTKFYKNNYKKFLILPVLFFIFSVYMMYVATTVDGTPIYRDISLKGGLSAIVQIETEMSSFQLEERLEESFSDYSFTISELFDAGKKVGFIIDTDVNEELLIQKLQEIFPNQIKTGENYTSNFISPTLSNAFFKQAVYILIISFVLMSFVVFLYFRKFVPSFAVVLSAIFDITVTIGILNFLGFKISVAGIGALLMLIGYSIDTDVLLTNRLIKERGDNYYEKTFFAFKTGSLMSFTTLIAGCAAIYFTNSEIILQIAIILVVGLIVDYISTWIQNAGILLWWLENKEN